MAKKRKINLALERQGIVAVAATVGRANGLPAQYAVAKIVAPAKLATKQATIIKPTGKLLATVRRGV